VGALYTIRPFATLSRLAVFVALASAAFAHDIPNDVSLQTFFKPSGQHAELLMRVPLKAMRDIVFPEKPSTDKRVGYLDLEKVDPMLPGAASLWLSDFIDLYEGDSVLPKPRIVATRISLESDKSFADFDTARAHVTGPKLPPETNVVWDQTYLDVLFEYPIHSDQSLFSIHARLENLGLRVNDSLRFIAPSGTIRAFELEGNPGLVRLDPRWYQAAARFIRSGFLHVLDGTDHLLFLLCLVIPFRKLRALIPIVTAFTVAHSITLIASAYDLAPDALWFPPLIETLIAASIVYMALENIAGTSTVHRRWIITFAFGLVHGFGFSFALRQTLQFAGSHMLTSLLSFNIGVELGQLLVLIVFIPVLDLLFRFVVAERMGTIILSAIVAHTGWHWMLDRGSQLQKFHFAWPDLTPAFLASLLRGAMVVVFLVGVLWLLSLISKRADLRDSERES
jgi:HupE / UreJ protein